MWQKTSAALIGGCLLSISLTLNLNYLLPLSVDALLVLGIALAFPIWAALMVWCYSSSGGMQAWKRCSGLMALSLTLNIVLFFTQA
jgi:hypothetical protein